MTEKNVAKLFMHGRSQAVRLPKAFRMPGTEVRVRKVGNGVMLEPIVNRTPEEIRAIFAKLDRLNHELGPFMPEAASNRLCRPMMTYRQSTDGLPRHERRDRTDQQEDWSLE